MTHFCWVFLLLFWLVGPGSAFSQALPESADFPTIVSPPTQDRLLLDKAKRLFESQQIEDTLSTLEEYIEQGPPPTQLQEAYFLQAAALRMNNQERQAASTLEQLLDQFPVSPLANEARLILSELYVTLEDYERATAVLKKVLDYSSDPSMRRDALRQIREIDVVRGQPLTAIQNALQEMTLVGYADRLELKGVIQDLILQQLDESSLEELLEAYPTRYPGDLATIRLIELHTSRGDEVLAERDIRSFVKQFPNHPYAQTAMALLQSFMNKIKVHKHVIAAFLPFSGPMKAFGTDSLNGIRMALDDGKARLGVKSVGLVVKDTASSVSPLRYELPQIIHEFNPIATIGPLLSREIQAVSNMADDYEIPIVTPSATLLNIRQFGSYWFSTALTSSLQAHQLVKYAMTELGHKRFCIIFPQSAYGREFSQVFTKTVEDAGGTIIAVESYTEDETDIAPQILRLKEKDLTLYGSTETEKTSTGGKRTVYTPGFDAVFLPGQPVHVASIAAQLAFYDINVPLFGGNSWHSPDLFRWARHGVDGSIFTDGLFLESPDPNVQDFAQRYRARFRAEPSLFSIQAYDAAWLLLDAIRNGAQSGPEVREQLVRRHDLPALSGFASFGSDGILHRKVYIIQVTKGQFVRID